MKKFIKTVSFIFALLLIVSLLGAFTSCAEPDEGISDPTENDGDPAGAPESDPNKNDGDPAVDPSIDIEVNVDISSEAKSEIQSKFFEKTYEEEYDEFYNSPDQVELTCYGIFDDAYCVIVTYPSPHIIPSVEVEEKVGKYTFVFNNSSQMIDVYCNGEFYTLTKAYENGILDDTELGALYNYYTSTKWGKVK